MKRFLSLLLSLSLLLTLTAHAAPADNEPWNRMEPGGRYITLRLDYPQGEDSLWQDSRYYYARYADTKEPIPLTSPYLDGALYVTVPTGQEERPMEVLQGDPVKFLDCYTTWMENGTLKKAYANAPLGADVLNLRGLFLGDEKGNLRPEQVLTRAEAFTVLLRLLGADLSAGDDTAGFRDVSPDDWFFPTAMAARRLGLTNEPDLFRPTDAVSRGEFTVMLHRAMKAIGWLEKEFDDVELTFRDAADLPDWAREAYEGLAPYRVQIRTQVDSDIMGEYGPEQDFYATKADLLATLDRGRTETFTFGKLKVEVSHALAVRKVERLAEGIQPYEETVFTCTPGATLTVLDPDLDDPAYTEDHAAHPNWGLYDFETDVRVELTGAMEAIALDETTDCLFDLESGIALLSFEFVE